MGTLAREEFPVGRDQLQTGGAIDPMLMNTTKVIIVRQKDGTLVGCIHPTYLFIGDVRTVAPIQCGGEQLRGIVVPFAVQLTSSHRVMPCGAEEDRHTSRDVMIKGESRHLDYAERRAER